jgi:hypothetical protein
MPRCHCITPKMHKHAAASTLSTEPPPIKQQLQPDLYVLGLWFITGCGKCHYVCVVSTTDRSAPLQRHPTTVPIRSRVGL